MYGLIVMPLTVGIYAIWAFCVTSAANISRVKIKPVLRNTNNGVKIKCICQVVVLAPLR